MNESLVLFGESHWISPYVFTCFVALREKGIPFDHQEIALHDQGQKRPEYAKASITARVPALRHGDFSLAESSAIVEYIEDVFGTQKYPPALPEDPRDRARARQVMAWIRSDDTLPLRNERPTTTMFYEPAQKPLTEAGQACVGKVLEVADRLLKGDRPSLFKQWCVADSDLAFLLQRLLINDHTLPPKLENFATEQWQRKSVQEFVDKKRPAYQEY